MGGAVSTRDIVPKFSRVRPSSLGGRPYFPPSNPVVIVATPSEIVFPVAGNPVLGSRTFTISPPDQMKFFFIVKLKLLRQHFESVVCVNVVTSPIMLFTNGSPFMKTMFGFMVAPIIFPPLSVKSSIVIFELRAILPKLFVTVQLSPAAGTPLSGYCPPFQLAESVQFATLFIVGAVQTVVIGTA